MAERRRVTIDLVTRTQGGTRGIKNLKNNLGGLNAQTVKTNKGLGGISKNTASAKRGLGSLIGGAGGAGLAMTGVGVAVLATGAILKGSIGAFASFDDKMNQSVAIMGDVSDAMRKDMSDAAREMAKTTRFSADEAAESYFFLASAGLDAEQSIAALPAVAAFGQAGMFDMALATDLLTDAQSALGLTVDDSAQNLKNMTRVSDVFVKANTLANTSVQQVSEAITNKLGAALRASNISIEEGVAVLAAYADQGLKGASAGEAFNIVLRDLKKVGRESADILKANNIEIFDAQGNFKHMADIIRDLENAFEGLTVQEQAQLAADLGFQDRSFKNIQLLIGQSDAIRQYDQDLQKAGGTTEEVAGKQMESFSAQMGLLKSRVIDAGISLGESLAPVVLEIASGFLDMLEAIMPLISGAAKLFKVLFKFSALSATFKLLGAAGKGFTRLSGIWDEGARTATTLTDAADGMTKKIEDGMQPAAALANSFVFLLTKGELTAETMSDLAGELDLTAGEIANVTASTLEWARANDSSAVEVLALEFALRDQILAMELSTEETRALMQANGVLKLVQGEMTDSWMRGDQAVSELTDAEGNLVDENGNLIDSTGNLIDAQGRLIDAEGNLITETLSLAEALEIAEENQTSLADAIRAAADPLFAASSAMKGLIEAEKNLIEVQDDHHASATELAEAELAVLDATLKTQGALDGLDAAGLEDQITIVQDVLNKSRDEAILFLEALGLIDGTQVELGVNTVFTSSGTSAAKAAAVSSARNLFREHGGRTGAGQPTIVGESGPELFIPQRGGQVVPNDMLMAGATSNQTNETHQTINFVNPNLANDPVKALRSRFAFDTLAGRA